jgi:hypothetical protein
MLGDPARCAKAITGTSQARDTRFGSSNDVCVLARPCNNRAYKVPLELDDRSVRYSHHPRSEGAFYVAALESSPVRPVD